MIIISNNVVSDQVILGFESGSMFQALHSVFLSCITFHPQQIVYKGQAVKAAQQQQSMSAFDLSSTAEHS